MQLKFPLSQIFIGAFLLASLHLHAQNSLLNISMSDTTFEAVISEIRKQTDMDFIFNHEELERIPLVSIEVNGATVDHVLEQCLENTGLGFEKINNTIIITPEKKEDGFSRKTQRTQTLRGTVIDRDSRVPLPFASVVIMDTNPQRGSTTDLDGNFSFNELPVGRYTLQISYVGYEEALVQEILLGSAKEVVVSVEIRERTQSLGEVFVRYKKGEALDQMTTVSSRSFSVEETKRYPASVSDPARMAQVFAGVSGTDDSSNEIVIRGNSP